jgi:hypothetical protein
MRRTRRRFGIIPPGKGFSVRLVMLTLFATFAGSLLARAEPADSSATVDLELVLAADVSGSMTKNELRIQREGYVNALRSPQVINAILSGPRGRIAIAYFEWASPDYQRLIVPWTVIDGPDSARSFADTLEGQPMGTSFYGGLAGGGTSISGALFFSSRLLQNSSVQSDRRIIDVSGDGPNNGLAISISENSFEGQTLGPYYKGCVIGGPGAFVITIGDRADFARAIRRKLLREIASAAPRVELAAVRVSPRIDCHAIEQSIDR